LNALSAKPPSGTKAHLNDTSMGMMRLLSSLVLLRDVERHFRALTVLLDMSPHVYSKMATAMSLSGEGGEQNLRARR
jgi:hypothetical protein